MDQEIASKIERKWENKLKLGKFHSETRLHSRDIGYGENRIFGLIMVHLIIWTLEHFPGKFPAKSPWFFFCFRSKVVEKSLGTIRAFNGNIMEHDYSLFDYLPFRKTIKFNFDLMTPTVQLYCTECS